MSTARHHMQEDDLDHDATTNASKSYVKPMKDKRDDALRMVEQLIAEEKQRSQTSAMRTYLIAAIIGLVFWAVVYFIWRIFLPHTPSSVIYTLSLHDALPI